MAKFIPGVDTAITASEPLLEIMATASTPLPVGKQVFQLIVTDNAGNSSTPTTVSVLVMDRSKPTAVIDLLREDGSRVYDATLRVPYGKPFKLTGDRSSDLGGNVTSWRWTLL